MAWNEPGGNGDKDPWSGNRPDQGPPDLDEVVRKLQERFGGLFGGKGSGGGGGGGASGLPGTMGKGLWWILGVVVIVWLASGIYIVDPAERGVVLRFGAYQDVTAPGPHWHIPFPIERVIEVNVDQVSTFRHKAEMLTKDENIVDVELTIQSRIQDPANYLFQDWNPEKTLRDATETAVREAVGKNDLDFILTEGRSRVAAEIKKRAQALIDVYKTGLIITSVNMQPAKPPEQVKSAFDDAIKAREDKERLENKAEAYANQIIPQARGEAARILADAKAYRDKTIAEAEGIAARFIKVYDEYKKAPEVTRRRLYLDTMETVLSRTGKVLVDVPGGNNLMYLPLDKLLQSRGADQGVSPVTPPKVRPASRGGQRPMREVERGRRISR